MKKLSVSFQNVKSTYLKDAFVATLDQFYPLHKHHITLKKKNVKHTTMEAQPAFNWNFFDKEKRSYQVHFREATLIHPNVRVVDLPESVLQGWYAHELGHIIDYQDRGAWEMIKFGFRYLFFDGCKREAEKMADIYAIKYGFKEEIKAMKTYIIEHADIDEKYRARIKKFYPGPEEIEHLILEHGE